MSKAKRKLQQRNRALFCATIGSPNTQILALLSLKGRGIITRQQLRDLLPFDFPEDM